MLEKTNLKDRSVPTVEIHHRLVEDQQSIVEHKPKALKPLWYGEFQKAITSKSLQIAGVSSDYPREKKMSYRKTQPKKDDKKPNQMSEWSIR